MIKPQTKSKLLHVHLVLINSFKLWNINFSGLMNDRKISAIEILIKRKCIRLKRMLKSSKGFGENCIHLTQITTNPSNIKSKKIHKNISTFVQLIDTEKQILIFYGRCNSFKE
ncbi:hypothetical protein AAHE18_03G154400 [Arachis hypogaea]